MSTPIETNTEELQEVLQQVYNLPSRSASSDSYDMMLQLDMPEGESLWEYAFTYDNLTVVSGDFHSVVDKLTTDQPVKIGVICHTYYWNHVQRGFANVLNIDYNEGSGALGGAFTLYSLYFRFNLESDGTCSYFGKENHTA